MENLKKLPTPNSLTNSPNNSSVRRILDERLIESEALKAVGRMIAGYANQGQAGRSYIGAIAALLMQYPRSIALRCADPFHGVVRETKFMPTPSDVIAWCERRRAPILAEADREQRVSRQLAERDAWETQVIADGLKAKGQAWLDRTDPIAKQLTSENTERTAAQRAAGLEIMQAANRAVFERDCKAAGIDPARGISPALMKAVGGT